MRIARRFFLPLFMLFAAANLLIAKPFAVVSLENPKTFSQKILSVVKVLSPEDYQNTELMLATQLAMFGYPDFDGIDLSKNVIIGFYQNKDAVDTYISIKADKNSRFCAALKLLSDMSKAQGTNFPRFDNINGYTILSFSQNPVSPEIAAELAKLADKKTGLLAECTFRMPELTKSTWQSMQTLYLNPDFLDSLSQFFADFEDLCVQFDISPEIATLNFLCNTNKNSKLAAILDKPISKSSVEYCRYFEDCEFYMLAFGKNDAKLNEYFGTIFVEKMLPTLVKDKSQLKELSDMVLKYANFENEVALYTDLNSQISLAKTNATESEIEKLLTFADKLNFMNIVLPASKDDDPQLPQISYKTEKINVNGKSILKFSASVNGEAADTLYYTLADKTLINAKSQENALAYADKIEKKQFAKNPVICDLDGQYRFLACGKNREIFADCNVYYNKGTVKALSVLPMKNLQKLQQVIMGYAAKIKEQAQLQEDE